MFSTHCRKDFLTYPVILTRFIFFLSLVVTSSVTFAHDADYLGLVRTIQTRYLNVSNPAGLAFSSKAKTFLVMDTPGSEKSSAKVSTSIIMITPTEDLMGSVYIADHITDPINMAFDKKANRLLIFQSITKELIEIEAKSDGYLDPNTITKYDARKFGLRKPQGMAIDSVRGHLFILDSAVPEIVHIKPNSDQNFDDVTISHIYLGQIGKSDLRGIAFNPVNDHLFILNSRKQMLYELTRTGKIVARRNVSECKLQDPQSMVFAPSGDLTDDPSQMSLYIANRSFGNKKSQKTNSFDGIQTDVEEEEEQGYGNIVELSLTQPLVAAATSNASLVQTINTFQFSPPSSDPSGITYLPSSNSLLISDAEVDEVSIFTGDNLFEMNLAGNLLDTLSVMSFSNEPAGITINPVNKHLFISDDVERKVFELDPGPDGIYNTSDDRVTSFSTKDFGSFDPEGVAYDSLQGALFIIDGLNAEIYRITPGNNGVFDGVFSPGDDQATHFDTASLGISDPEGIEYNADNDHLYIVGKPSTLLVEMTTTGILRRMFDISAANARKPAGLGIAPGSLDPNVMNLYIVDRGVDNDQNPNENDGKVYEFLLSPITPNNQMPMVNAGQDQTITLPTNAVLNNTVSDDGLPNPPGTVTTIWTKVSGPGAVTFANAGAVDTMASFSVAGTYGLRLTADDGELINSDEVTIVVLGTGNEVFADIRVAASSDDAEEKDSSSMILTSTDLEMVLDTSIQTLGMRFNGVDIPKDARILNAYIQFKVDEITSEATSLSIQAEDTDSATAFTSAKGNISSRTRTLAAVSWSPVAWTTKGEVGPNQQTPNISSVVQEIVDRPGWSSGNSLAVIITGTGKRVAKSYEGDPNGAPLLHMVYTVGQTNQPPEVDAGPNQTITLPASATLAGCSDHYLE